MKNRLFEKPALNNLSHVYELYEESGREDKNIEVNEKGRNKKNAKESSYTNMDECKEKEQAELLKDEKPKYYHKIPSKNEKMRSSGHQGNGPIQSRQEHFYR